MSLTDKSSNNASSALAGGFAATIATPPGKPAGVAALLTLRQLPYWGARIGAAAARWWGRPFRIGTTVIATRHADVTEGLARDLDYRIQPVNASKFDQIGYHFILGMDRSAELIAERRVLYSALAKVDSAALKQAAADHIARLLDGRQAIDVVEDYARPIAAATASRLFGIAPADNAAFMDAARAVFGNSFLNVGNDAGMTERALAGANLMSDWFEAEIGRRHAAGAPGSDMMGALLASGANDDLTRRTLGGMLVGAIDTTASSVAKIVTVMMADPALRTAMLADRANLGRLWGWCNEALRRWPHGPLVLRKASGASILGGTAVNEGDSVLFWTQAAMLDPQAFPEPLAMRTDRPGAQYLHLGGGLHPCAGRAINAWQIPLLLSGLLTRDPVRLGKLRWAGPFPAHLPLHFRKQHA